MFSWVKRGGGGVGEVTPEALKADLDAGADIQVLDVRPPEEYRLRRIPGAVLVPLPELGRRMGELDREREVVVYCYSGHRSALACCWLRSAGFTRVRNLAGGITAWSARVDATAAAS